MRKINSQEVNEGMENWQMDRIQALIDNREDRRKCAFDRRISNFYNASFKEIKSQFIADFEKRYLCWLMSETNGNVTRAALRVGKERRALGKLLKKYNIDKTRYITKPINRISIERNLVD